MHPVKALDPQCIQDLLLTWLACVMPGKRGSLTRQLLATRKQTMRSGKRRRQLPQQLLRRQWLLKLLLRPASSARWRRRQYRNSAASCALCLHPPTAVFILRNPPPSQTPPPPPPQPSLTAHPKPSPTLTHSMSNTWCLWIAITFTEITLPRVTSPVHKCTYKSQPRLPSQLQMCTCCSWLMPIQCVCRQVL